MIFPKLIGMMFFEARDEQGDVIPGAFSNMEELLGEPETPEETAKFFEDFGKLPRLSFHSENVSGTITNEFMEGALGLPDFMLFGEEATGDMAVIHLAGVPRTSPFRYRYEVDGVRYYGEFNAPWPESNTVTFTAPALWDVTVLMISDPDLGWKPLKADAKIRNISIPEGIGLGDFVMAMDIPFMFQVVTPPETYTRSRTVSVTQDTTVSFNFTTQSIQISTSSPGISGITASINMGFAEFIEPYGAEMSGGYSVTLALPDVNDNMPFSFSYPSVTGYLDFLEVFTITPKPYIPKTEITYIKSPHDFLTLRAKHGHFVQTSNFDMSTVKHTAIAERTFGKIEPWTGWYDGAGHTIWGLNGDDGNAPSMFGYIIGGHVENLVLEDVNFGGRTRGALATYCTASNFSKIGITGRIKQTIGPNQDPSFEMGNPDYTVFDYINNSVGVGAMFHLGSTMFLSEASLSFVSNCYSRCEIETTSPVAGSPSNQLMPSLAGGLFGMLIGVSHGSFSASSVLTGTESIPRIGVGITLEPMNNYYDSDVAGFESGMFEDGLPRTTTEMTYPYNEETTYIMWDWDNVWKIDPEINAGYPYLFPLPDASVMPGNSRIDGGIQVLKPHKGILNGVSAFAGGLTRVTSPRTELQAFSQVWVSEVVLKNIKANLDVESQVWVSEVVLKNIKANLDVESQLFATVNKIRFVSAHISAISTFGDLTPEQIIWVKEEDRWRQAEVNMFLGGVAMTMTVYRRKDGRWTFFKSLAKK